MELIIEAYIDGRRIAGRIGKDYYCGESTDRKLER